VALKWVDHAKDPGAWASSLGVSRAAVDLLLGGPFIDLHNDLEVPVRLFGYDPGKRHGPWRRTVPFFGHTDYPRLREARLTGVVYDLATNVFRGAVSRQAVTLRNLDRCVAQIEAYGEDLAVAYSRSDYDRIVASGRTAMFLALQGGNALAHDPSVLEGEVGQRLHRITLVHLSSSVLGGSNSPSQADGGITERGRALVAACNRARVLVDLAHAGERTFWGALEAHDSTLPPIASHTGLRSCRDHWRNLSDDQCRAVADRGGVVGVIYQGNFLDAVPPGWPCARARILDHLERLIDVAGEASAAIGTDYDGMITPPHDLTDVVEHPRLVQDMLDRGWSEARVRRVLGENYLAVVAAIRP
jgi:membrane dipeptidase